MTHRLVQPGPGLQFLPIQTLSLLLGEEGTRGFSRHTRHSYFLVEWQSLQ